VPLADEFWSVASQVASERGYLVIGFSEGAEQPELGSSLDNVLGFKPQQRLTVMERTDWKDWKEQMETFYVLRPDWGSGQRGDPNGTYYRVNFVPTEVAVGGWLLVFCLVLTCVSPAAGLYYIFSHTIPTLMNPHTPVRMLPIFIIFPVLFIPIVVFGFFAGLKLWLVRPGAVSFARHYLLTYMGAHIAYFLVWVSWILIFQPNRPSSFAEMSRSHLVNPILFVAVWYFYLQRSERVRTTYLSRYGKSGS
jgi:hypothetical protein